VVVRQDRPLLAGGGAEVAARDAQVPGRGQRGVEDVEGIRHAVAVAVGRVALPGRRDELHRPDRAVINGVAVEGAAVGVADERGPAAVESDADDRTGRRAVCAQLGAAEAAVVRLDPADAGQQRPAQPTSGIGASDLPCGPLVGLECWHRNAATGQRGHQSGRGLGRRAGR
jgi:hypothetical protein